MRVVALVVLAAACGRIGYDPLTTGQDDGGSSDATLDNSDFAVLVSPGDASNPSIVSNGDGFGLAWHDTRDSGAQIYFARIDASGSKIGSEQRITNTAGASRDAEIAWDGTGYGLTWLEEAGTEYDVYFARLDVSGNLLAGPTQLTSMEILKSLPVIEYAENQYSVVWSDTRTGSSQSLFAAFDSAGAQVVAPVQVINSGGSTDDASIAYSSNAGLVLAWSDNRDGNDEIYSTRISATGTPVGAQVRSTNDAASSDGVQVVHGGSELGFLYKDDRTGTNLVYFSSHIAGGVIAVDQLPLSSGSTVNSAVSIAANNNTYVAVWEESLQIHYAYVVNGAIQSFGQVNSDLAQQAKSPDVVWSGTQFLVIWEDTRDSGDDALYMRALSL